MKPISTSSPHGDEQAALWAARLEDGDLSEAQCADLDTWLAADPRHRNALAEFCQLSTELDNILPHLFDAEEITPPVTARPTSRRWWWGAGLAAAAAVAVLFSFHSAPPAGPQRIATAIAEYQSIHLSDGTTVDLNAHTNLVFNATDTERRVRLGGGQAFFAVSKDPARPFIVDTPLGSVRVTGTAFDVRTLTAGTIAVTVSEGTVEVRLGENDLQTAAAPITLRANDQLSVAAGVVTIQKLSTETLADELAWREGYMILDETPLDEVLARYAHFHGIGISAAAEVAELTLSGRYPVADLDGFLLGLETIHPVRVIRDQSGTIRIVMRN